MGLILTGHDLTLAGLLSAAHGDTAVRLAPEGLERMRASRAMIDQVIADKVPVYGVTTGLGARAGEALDADTLAGFSLQTLRGRAHAIGAPMPRAVIRAAMILRANTLLQGYAGARPEVAAHIVACLNAGLTPVVGDTGSIGAADLIPNATLGLALVGEGEMTDAQGSTGPSDAIMRAAGIAPLTLGPRDGLALANHASICSASAAIAHGAAQTAFDAAQGAAALSLQAFDANLGPLSTRLLALRPLPGQMAAAAQLRALLTDSPLWQAGTARRLQDPLSFRNIPQIHGTVAAALGAAERHLAVEMNGSTDNPVVLVESGEALSTGNYFAAELANVADSTNRAFVHLSVAQLARMSKHLNPVFSDLPVFLADPDSGSNGFAPLMKTAEALLADLLHAAQPGPIWPSINANGVEDCVAGAPVALKSLAGIAALSVQLSAIELIIAAQASEARGQDIAAMGRAGALRKQVRAHVAPLSNDRPLGRDVTTLARHLCDGQARALQA